MAILGFFYLIIIYFAFLGYSTKQNYNSYKNKKEAIENKKPYYWDGDNKLRDIQTDKLVSLRYDPQNGDYLHAIDGSFDKPIKLEIKNDNSSLRYGRFEIIVISETVLGRKFYAKVEPIYHYYHIYEDKIIVQLDKLGISFYDNNLNFLDSKLLSEEELKEERQRLENLCKPYI